MDAVVLARVAPGLAPTSISAHRALSWICAAA